MGAEQTCWQAFWLVQCELAAPRWRVHEGKETTRRRHGVLSAAAACGGRVAWLDQHPLANDYMYNPMYYNVQKSTEKLIAILKWNIYRK